MRIEIGYLGKYLKSCLGRSRFGVRVCNDKIVRPGFHHEILLCIKVGEAGCYHDIVRLKAIDLLEHRDCFERELLFAVMLGNASKTGNGGSVAADPHVKIAKDI